MIVNTATGCGFTPQYEAIETLYEKYLGLKPDKNFYANNAAFPLLEWTGTSLSARIPFDFTENGALKMFTPMR